MTKKTIVTLSDSNYFPLLEELIHSVRKFKQSENINICVLDAGLSPDQIDLISTKVDEIKRQISEGRYPLDSKVIAKNFVALESMID